MVRLLIVLLLLVCTAPLVAQTEANVWYFGHGAGIDFNGGAPRALADGALRQKEGSASIADPVTGALLFYTDGVTVWNRDHAPMPNGTGLRGHDDATQSALIVPAPCAPDRFYIFTADASPLMDPPNDGIHYSLVDMTADGGRGDVILKNAPLFAPATEKLIAIQHANGIDYWVIAHEWGSNLYRAHLVSASGVSASAVNSYIGVAHDGAPEYGIGYMKASPNGRLIASIVTTSLAELFDFDPRTGLLSNGRRLLDHVKYGLSFSPDSRLLYVVQRRPGWSYDSLVQFDATLGSEAAIAGSRLTVGAGDFWALQLAPDGRIYIANNSLLLTRHRGWLATIDRPNDRGVACGLDLQGFRLEVAGAQPLVAEGLPNMIESFADGLVTACGPPIAAIGLDEPICAGTCTALRDSSRNLPTRWEWTFEGARPTSSTDENPGPICYDSAGVYLVRLVASSANGSDTVERTITVRAASSIRTEAGTVAVVPGDTAAIEVGLGALEPGAAIGSLTIRLGYDRTTMRFVDVDAVGALLGGWGLLVVDDTATSTIVVTATAPPGASVAGTGRLLTLRFATWLARTGSIDLPLELVVPGTVCSTVPGRAGRIDLELCGLQQRMIELDSSSLLLRTVTPNPAVTTARIAYRIPVEGRVRLVLLDARGGAVATLVDGSLGAGEHEATLETSEIPAGVYFLRLDSGDEVVLRPLLVRR